MSLTARMVLALTVLSLLMLYAKLSVLRFMEEVKETSCRLANAEGDVYAQEELVKAMREYKRFPEQLSKLAEWLNDVREANEYYSRRRDQIGSYLLNITSDVTGIRIVRRRVRQVRRRCILPRRSRQGKVSIGQDLDEENPFSRYGSQPPERPSHAKRLHKNRYCNELSAEHTMCRYPPLADGLVTVDKCDCPASSLCKTKVEAGLKSPTQKLILRMHNAVRNKVAAGLETRGLNGVAQPPAANMMELEWDGELASIAQRWAEQCLNASAPHDQDRRVLGHNWKRVGQSVLWSFNKTFDTEADATTSSSQAWTNVLNTWHREVDSFDPKEVDSYKGDNEENVTSHYTSMVWATTRKVGCGQATFVCRNPLTYEFGYCFKFVCNYGSGGNVIGHPVYVQGNAKCPVFATPSPKYSHLCRARRVVVLV